MTTDPNVDTTPGPDNFLRMEVAEARAKTTDPAELARLARVDAELIAWAKRDADEDTIKRLAPAPTLPCPSWCEHDAGHTWQWYDQAGQVDTGSPPRLTREHNRVLLAADHVHVDLTRTDSLDLGEDADEYVRGASRTAVEAGGGEYLTAEVTGQLARAAGEAQRLLLEGYAAGDPTSGRIDED